ncbi:hypothetical protein GGX14DRAFT_701593 [Mycena pura]|uniref:Uncharacterized protein n=1 Tax=Mycena pura TaxID=153505 RepID=A0AAD6Y0S8_9AGAR|nr:hypothetical protein GGX14DRAFT_701593 [Mycena pura]
MRFVSVIYVATALAWAVSGAPLPEGDATSSLNNRAGSDTFAELDLSAREPQDLADTPTLPNNAQFKEVASDRTSDPSGCVVA